IKKLCMDLRNLKNLRQENLKNKKTKTNLCPKYNLGTKGIAEAKKRHQSFGKPCGKAIGDTIGA
ncbi:hypothetical protein E2320_020569, partial [Naja naja]